MIKLIATDMDGTLLDDKKRLPPDFFEVVDRLCDMGVVFALSSGRTYSAIEHLFPPEYREKIDCICDNGACVVHKGSVISSSPLDRTTYERLLRAVDDLGGLDTLVCAKSGTYHKKAHGAFAEELQMYYKFHIECEDFLAITDDIYKLAVRDESGAAEHGKPAIDALLGDKLNIQVSSPVWMDIMAAGISKGSALSALQQKLGITQAQTMAFGDYFNDVDMLSRAEWSFCMENGHDDVKKLCRFTAPSNNDSGVTRSIRRYVFGEDNA